MNVLDDPVVAQLDRFITSVDSALGRITNILRLMQERVDFLTAQVESQEKTIAAICRSQGLIQ